MKTRYVLWFCFALLSLSVFAEEPALVLKSAYMAANEHNFRSANAYLPQEAVTQLMNSGEGNEALDLIKQGWLHITRNGTIETIEIIDVTEKQRNEFRIAFKLHYKNGAIAKYEDVVTNSSNVSALPVLDYVAGLGIQARLFEVERKAQQSRYDTVAMIRGVGSAFDDPGLRKQLCARADVVEKTPDAWGNPKNILCTTDLQHYWVVSHGADGKPDIGIYDADGFPLANAAGRRSNPDDDIIFSDGKFIREPLPLVFSLPVELPKSLSPAQTTRAVFLAANDYEFSRVYGYINGDFLNKKQEQFVALTETVLIRSWQELTRDGTLSEVKIINEEKRGNEATVKIELVYKDGSKQQMEEYLRNDQGVWKLVPPSSFTKILEQL